MTETENQTRVLEAAAANEIMRLRAIQRTMRDAIQRVLEDVSRYGEIQESTLLLLRRILRTK